mgnify:CR=1 FL=1
MLDTGSWDSRRTAQWSCSAALVALIVGLSLPRFALFEHGSGDMLATHLALEMFSAIVATLVVVISWHTFRREDQALARPLIFTFTVVAGPASKLAFTTQPGGGASGIAWAQQPIVTVQDAAGNTVTEVDVAHAAGRMKPGWVKLLRKIPTTDASDT